jgi:hypothetical protein
MWERYRQKLASIGAYHSTIFATTSSATAATSSSAAATSGTKSTKG